MNHANLQIPPIHTGRSPKFVSKAIDFVTKSVVMIACAAASDPVCRDSNQLGIPLRRISMGIRLPITPVELVG